jgi:cyclophilin family peptidyl-prolyl cis-trans isomerase
MNCKPSFNPVRLFVVLPAVFFLSTGAISSDFGLNSGVLHAQEEEKKPDAPPAGESGKQEGTEKTPETVDDGSLESLMAKYAALVEEMATIELQVATAGDRRGTIETTASYTAKNNELIALVEKIEEAALAKFKAGDREKSTQELLLGVIINHAFFERDVKAFELGQILIDGGVERKYFDQAATAERLQASPREILKELALRADEAKADDLPRVRLETSKGNIVLELFENQAPQTVGNFVSLVESGFYNGIKFHRVLDGFMAQAGCPEGTGSGGPGYSIYCECYKSDFRRHFAGSLSMAKTDARDTGGSQFFITFARTAHLDGKHTVFGRVIEGADIANSLQRIDPERPDASITPDTIIKAEVLRKREHEYKPVKVGG